jgi:ribose transport system ATP-binding protein
MQQSRSDTPLWELRDITKRYPGVTANDGVTLRLLPGEIHGLLGENGCGKSTLIKILSGVEAPSEGQIFKDGEPIVLHSPVEARAAGIATVFQEFSLVPDLSVSENIFLGRLPTRTRSGLLDRKRMDAHALETLRVLGIDGEIEPRAIVRNLSVAQQQLVEIAKAVSAQAKTLILDEPTAALGHAEIARLHALVRRLKEGGHAILYVSHRLDEVVSLIDVVTILKDGRRVRGPGEIEISLKPIVAAMIGQDVAEHYPGRSHPIGDVLFAAQDVSTERGVANISFSVRAGEIFGIGGVMGSCRTSLMRAIFGLDALTTGAMTLADKPYLPRSTAEAIARGVALLPENRKTDGLFFNFDGPENATIASLERIARNGLLDFRAEQLAFARLTAQLAIHSRASQVKVGGLSGGNQQKIVLSRWMFRDAALFLLDEPTQGIDVGAKATIYQEIRKLGAAGKAIILVTSDFEELLALSDRIAILRNGAITEIRPASSFDEYTLSAAAAGDTPAKAERGMSMGAEEI